MIKIINLIFHRYLELSSVGKLNCQNENRILEYSIERFLLFKQINVNNI